MRVGRGGREEGGLSDQSPDMQYLGLGGVINTSVDVLVFTKLIIVVFV